MGLCWAVERAYGHEVEKLAVDLYGDPLPAGAIARLGTVRFRHGNSIYRAALSADGRLLATAGGHPMTHVWDVATGKAAWQFKTGTYDEVALAPDGKLLAVGGSQGVFIYDLATGKQVRQMKLFQVFALDFAANGKTLAIGLLEGDVYLYDAETGLQKAHLQKQFAKMAPKPGGRQLVLRAVLFSPDGRLLATADDVNEIILWDVASQKQLGTLLDNGKYINALAFTPDSARLASGGEDQVVRIWDVQSGKVRHRCQGHQGAISSLAFAADGKTLASGSGYSPRRGGKHELHAFRLWDAATGRELAKWGGCGEEGVAAVFFAKDRRSLISAGEGSIRHWDLATKKEIQEFGGHTSGVWALAFSPDGKHLATGGGDHTIRLWDLASTKEVRRLIGCSGGVDDLVFSPNGKVLYSGSRDGMVRFWEVFSGKATGQFKNDDDRVSVAVSRDGTLLASGSSMGNIIVWDTKSKQELRRFAGRKYDEIHSLDFSPDGKWLATGTFNQLIMKRVQGIERGQPVRIWDVGKGKEARRLENESPILAVAISPDGQWLASGSMGDGARLWHLATGRAVKNWAGQWVHSLKFSPDGKNLALVDFGSTAYLYEVISGKERRRFAASQHDLTRIAFSPDGRILATGDSGGSILLWVVYGRDEKRPNATYSPDALDALWQALAADDAASAFEAVCKLRTVPEPAVRLLRARLQPASVDRKSIDRLVADLGSTDFKTRVKASAELEKLEDLAEPALQKALADKAPLEVRRRIEDLLAKGPRTIKSPEALRGIRSVEILEHIASREARAVLQKLAAGAPEARLTQEARAALKRLSE